MFPTATYPYPFRPYRPPKTQHSVEEVPGLLSSYDPRDGRRPPSHRSHRSYRSSTKATEATEATEVTEASEASEATKDSEALLNPSLFFLSFFPSLFLWRLSSPLGGRAWFGGTSPCIMWAGFEEGPAGFRTEDPQALHSMHTPHPQLHTPLLASPEGLSHLPEHRWRMQGPFAHWEGGARAGAPSGPP